MRQRIGKGDQRPGFMRLAAFTSLLGLMLSPIAAALSPAPPPSLALEAPADGAVVSGISNIQGWSFYPQSPLESFGVERVELWIDGVYTSDIPFGGLRRDVAGAFPDSPMALASGFSQAYNFSDLQRGEHTIEVRACPDVDRNDTAFYPLICARQRSTINVVRFNDSFLPEDRRPTFRNPAAAVNSAEGTIGFSGLQLYNGNTWDVILEWNTATQGFEIKSLGFNLSAEVTACLTTVATDATFADREVTLSNNVTFANDQGFDWLRDQRVLLFKTRAGGWKVLTDSLTVSGLNPLMDVQLTTEPENCSGFRGEALRGWSLNRDTGYRVLMPSEAYSGPELRVGAACGFDSGEIITYFPYGPDDPYFLDLESGRSCRRL